jgi:membrane dipeptidase
MEGADAIREPAEVAEWFAAGVRLVGPAWAKTRYAGGTGDPGPLTPAGRDLLHAMAEVGMILDLSHMTDEGILEALESYPGPLVASHCNTRSLVPTTCPERHLTDDMARRIAARQGVIGVMLFNCFLKDGLKFGGPRQLVTMAEVIAHIDHYCQLVGHTRHIGLGSDFDGGFGLADVPTDFESIADLGKIGEALAQRGYAPADIEGIMGGNWLKLLQRTLPEV